MINIIEFLLINLVILIFLNNSYLSFIYGIVIVCIALIYSFIYYKKLKKVNKDQLSKYKDQFSLDFVIVSLMILLSNLVYNIGIFNLIFSLFINIFFIVKMIILICKNDFIRKKKYFNSNYIFDLYCVVYLSCILISTLSYRI